MGVWLTVEVARVGMQQMWEALTLVKQHPDRADFMGPRDAALIAQAEQVLGGIFPPTYRFFLERLGAGNFGSFEVYGIVGLTSLTARFQMPFG